MHFEYLEKIKSFISDVAVGIKELDTEVNEYKSVGQNPYLPTIAYVNWAVHLMNTGESVQAEEKLLYSTLMAHQNPTAYIHLGILKAREKDYESAINYFTKAIRLDQNNAKAYCFLANTLTEIQDFTEAEKKFKYAQKLEPNNSEIYTNWGLSLIRQKKLLQAREKFQQACKFNLSNFNALYFWGIVEMELGELQNAKEKFKLINSVLPNHSDSLYYTAYLEFKNQNYNASLTSAIKSSEINPEKIEAYMLIGENYMYLKEEQNCLAAYKKGHDKNIKNHHFYNSWGLALLEFDRIEEAKEKFNYSLELNHDNSLAMTSLGIASYKTQEQEKAIGYFEKALGITPENTIALNHLGQIYFEKEEYKQSIQHFERALKISAKEVANYYKIANCFNADKNVGKAVEYYKKATEYQPNEIKVYIDYATILIEQNDLKQATRQIKKACKIDDKNAEALNILFYLSYLLAKENLYEYNIREAINIAKKIEDIDLELFKYSAEKEELQNLLKGGS